MLCLSDHGDVHDQQDDHQEGHDDDHEEGETADLDDEVIDLGDDE